MFQPRKVISPALGHFKKNTQIVLTRNENLISNTVYSQIRVLIGWYVSN